MTSQTATLIMDLIVKLARLPEAAQEDICKLLEQVLSLVETAPTGGKGGRA